MKENSQQKKRIVEPDKMDNELLKADVEVYLDDAAFDKRSDTKVLMKAARHTILWPPPYRPNQSH